MFLQRTEQFHGFLLKEFAYFAQRIYPTRSDGLQAVNIRQSCDLSGSALDREHLFDLVGLAAVDGRLAAFVVERVDDHFEFAVAIQVKDGADLVHVRSNRLVRLRLKLTGHKLRLNFAGDHASQNDDGITSRPRRVYWRLWERGR